MNQRARLLLAVLTLCVALPGVAQTIPPVEANETPLHWAARHALVGMARGLLANGALVDAPDQFGRTPLHRGVASVQMVRLLLEAGADPNAADMFGRTPLHHALQYPETVAILLEAGANVFARDFLDQTPLERTLRYGPRSRNLLVIEMLIGAGAGTPGR